MDQTFSVLLGAVIFTAFVVGLAFSINAIPFYVIVALVVAALYYDDLLDIKIRHRVINWRKKQ